MHVKTTETQKQNTNSTYAWTAVRYRLWRALCYADRVEDDNIIHLAESHQFSPLKK